VVEQRGGEIDDGHALRRNPYKMMLSRSRRAEALRHISEENDVFVGFVTNSAPVAFTDHGRGQLN